MAVIPTWQPSIQKQAGNMEPVYAPMGDMGKSVFNGMTKINSALLEYQEKQDTVNSANIYTNAIGQIDDTLHGDGGLLTLQGKNAIDLPEAPGQQAQDGAVKRAKLAFNTIMSNAIRSGQNKNQQLMIQQSLSSIMPKYLDATMKHQDEQQKAVDAADFKAGIETSSKAVANSLAVGNYDLTVMNLRDLMHRTNIQGKLQGWSNDVIKDTSDTAMSNSVYNALSAQATAGNVALVRKGLTDFGDKLNANQKTAIESKLKPLEEQNQIYSEFAVDKNNPKYQTNGIFDSAKYNTDIEAKYGPNATKTTTKPGVNASYEQAKAGIVGGESGGSYTAVNPDSGAYGKYQFMPDTWRSNAAAILGDPNAQMTPENQDKVFDATYKPIYDQWGPEALAVSIYAGPGNAKRWAECAPDAIGDNGQHYSWDARQGANGKYPSIREYVKNTVGSLSTPDAIQAVSTFDVKKYETLKQMGAAEEANQRQQKNQAEHDELVNVRNKLAGVTDLQQRIAIVKNSGLQPYEIDDMVSSMIKAAQTGFKSDIGARYQLESAIIDGTLTQDMVRSAATMLTQEDQLKYSVEARKIALGQNDKESQEADKTWKQDIDTMFPGQSNTDRRQSLTLQYVQRLNDSNTKGWTRYTSVKDMMKAEGVTSGATSKADAVINVATANNEQFGRLEQDFDPQLVRLAQSGIRRSGGNPSDAWSVNVLLSRIGADINAGDENSQKAIDYMKLHNIPITEESYLDAHQMALEGTI